MCYHRGELYFAKTAKCQKCQMPKKNFVFKMPKIPQAKFFFLKLPNLPNAKKAKFAKNYNIAI